jgi:hypothetical protein
MTQTCRLEPFIAASSCPPWEYFTPLHCLAIISLTRCISSNSRESIWIFSAKATAIYIPEGCTERPIGSSSNSLISSIRLSAAFHTLTVQSRPVVTITFFHKATSIPVIPDLPAGFGPWKDVRIFSTPEVPSLIPMRFERLKPSNCCLSVGVKSVERGTGG